MPSAHQNGIEDENRAEPRVYPDDYQLARTPAFLPLGERPFTTRIRVTLPDDYKVNSTGVLMSEEVSSGRRTTVWDVSSKGVAAQDINSLTEELLFSSL